MSLRAVVIHPPATTRVLQGLGGAEGGTRDEAWRCGVSDGTGEVRGFNPISM